MPEERLLNFEELIAPIPGDDPAGQHPLSIWQDLAEERRDNSHLVVVEDSSEPPGDLKLANWSEVQRKAEDALRDKSKDLKIAAHLTEALFVKHGFQGLCDGLHLLYRLVDECWDRLYPKIDEDGDVDRRATAFQWLDQPDSGAQFPGKLRTWPLIVGKEKSFSWIDFDEYQHQRGDKEGFEKAQRESSWKVLSDLDGEISGCQSELEGLAKLLVTKMGKSAPLLNNLPKVLGDCRMVVKGVLAKFKPPADPDSNSPDGTEVQDPGTSTGAARRGGSREQAYRMLAQAADMLESIEPHSPIPFLVRRAVRLEKLPFPKMIREFIRQDDVLMALDREIGVGANDGSSPPGESKE